MTKPTEEKGRFTLVGALTTIDKTIQETPSTQKPVLASERKAKEGETGDESCSVKKISECENPFTQFKGAKADLLPFTEIHASSRASSVQRPQSTHSSTSKPAFLSKPEYCSPFHQSISKSFSLKKDNSPASITQEEEKQPHSTFSKTKQDQQKMGKAEAKEEESVEKKEEKEANPFAAYLKSQGIVLSTPIFGGKSIPAS